MNYSSSDEEWTHVLATSTRGRISRRRVRRNTVRTTTMSGTDSGPTADQIAIALRDLIAASTTAAAPTPVARKQLSKWGTTGLNISDPGFSKLHSKEMKFESTKTLYDLEKEKFLNFSNNLVEKVNRIYARSDFTMEDSSPTPTDCFVLTEYTKLSRTNIVTARNARWPNTDPGYTTQSEYDTLTDSQIKASTVGNYIHEGLSTNAKRQLKADEDLFLVKDLDGNIFFDGPSYFWKIAEIVDPDNDSLVETEKTKLRNLHVKNFGYSVISMLAEFKNLTKRIHELGGVYSNDEQFLDFWNAVATMKEKVFAAYVSNQKDTYRETAKHSRSSIEDYIQRFTKKETSMIEDKKWNVASAEEQMIMALVSVIDSQSNNDKKKRFTEEDLKKASSDNTKKSDPSSQQEKTKRKESKIPEWKKEAPTNDDPHEKEVDGRTYYWCSKCREGKGMWALHKESEHTNNFRGNNKQKDATGSKSVRFTNNTKSNKDDSTSDSESDGTPSIKVNKELLKNAKAYLAQFKDFQEGGTQG